jgi:hypothetical protein
LRFVVIVQTFVPYVQDLKEEVPHSVMRSANFALTSVMLVLRNVRDFQHTIAVKSVPKHAENVLLSAVKCNPFKFPLHRVS